MKTDKVAIGLDFGTESVRAILIDLQGNQLSEASHSYKHGQILKHLPHNDTKLPPDFALQHPSDWIDSSAIAVMQAISDAGVNPDSIVGIGTDFTSCTMLPAKADGTPLCLLDQYKDNPYAWPKLWKHHGAKEQTQRINELAIKQKVPWLKNYGNIIGLEWFFPKILETLDNAPEIYNATDVWIEAGDWFTWQLVGAGDQYPVTDIPRSTCMAGYKALWNSSTGYPSPDFFKALNPKMENVISEKVTGRLIPPGNLAGNLCKPLADIVHLPAGIPVASPIIDAHSGVPGVGAAESGELVMVMGTSSCHMLNSNEKKFAPGIAGIVKDGILPGFFGYETGQAAVGDAFAWFQSILGNVDYETLTEEVKQIPPGSNGVLCLDWFNGCRTPLMDGSLKGAFKGLTMNHTRAHMFRALLEASAYGFKWILDVLRENGIHVSRLIATGGLPHHNPLLVQIYSDVIGEPIEINACKQGPAVGAAILGACAADASVTGFSDISEAVKVMTSQQPAPTIIKPNFENNQIYLAFYKQYLAFAKMMK